MHHIKWKTSIPRQQRIIELTPMPLKSIWPQYRSSSLKSTGLVPPLEPVWLSNVVGMGVRKEDPCVESRKVGAVIRLFEDGLALA